MRVHHLRALIPIVALAGAIGDAHAEPVPRVGVVVAVRVNLSADEASALGGALGAAIQEAVVVDVVAGAEAQRRLPDEIEELCLSRPECVRDIAARLNADQLLFVVAVRLGTRIQLDPTWTNADGTQTASRDAIIIDKDKPPRDVFVSAVMRLLPNATPRQPGQSTPATTGGASSGAGAGSRPDDVVVGGEPRSGGSRIHLGTWIAGGVAVAALAGGVGFGLAARSADGDLDDRGCDQMPCPDSDVDALERKMLVADLLYGTAIVAAGTAVAIQLIWGGPKDGPPVTAIVSRDAAGIAVRGSF